MEWKQYCHTYLRMEWFKPIQYKRQEHVTTLAETYCSSWWRPRIIPAVVHPSELAPLWLLWPSSMLDTSPLLRWCGQDTSLVGHSALQKKGTISWSKRVFLPIVFGVKNFHQYFAGCMYHFSLLRSQATPAHLCRTITYKPGSYGTCHLATLSSTARGAACTHVQSCLSYSDIIPAFAKVFSVSM